MRRMAATGMRSASGWMSNQGTGSCSVRIEDSAAASRSGRRSSCSWSHHRPPVAGQYLVQTLIDSNLFDERVLNVSDQQLIAPEEEASESVN